MASDSSDGEDYVFVGTALQEEGASVAGQYRKTVTDPAATRAAPLWQQEATDEQGRRRFHGAFTGGFSAGYYNTVGSKVAPKLCHCGYCASSHAPAAPSPFLSAAAGGLHSSELPFLAQRAP